jgi:hypothetical protein
MDRAELAAVHEALDCARVDVEESCGLGRRQQRRLLGDWCGGGATSLCRTAALFRDTFDRFVVPSRCGSFRRLARVTLRRLGPLVVLEEGELAGMEPHEKRRNLSSTRNSVNTRVEYDSA